MKLKNISSREWTIKGVGLFRPGEEREVPDQIAQEFSQYPGWEVMAPEKPKKEAKRDS